MLGHAISAVRILCAVWVQCRVVQVFIRFMENIYVIAGPLSVSPETAWQAFLAPWTLHTVWLHGASRVVNKVNATQPMNCRTKNLTRMIESYRHLINNTQTFNPTERASYKLTALSQSMQTNPTPLACHRWKRQPAISELYTIFDLCKL